MFKRNKLKSLLTRSNRVIKVFTYTASTLASVNLDIEQEQNIIALEHDKLQRRDDALQEQKEKNETLLKNINYFLGLSK